MEIGLHVASFTWPGGPGAIAEHLTRVVEDCKNSAADVYGVSLGVRVYPGTRMGQAFLNGDYQSDPGLKGCISSNDHLIEPVFYVSHQLGAEPQRMIAEIV